MTDDDELTVRDVMPRADPTIEYTQAERELAALGAGEHRCPLCWHECRVLERDLASFMRTGTFHPDAVRGTAIDPQLPDAVVRGAEAQGFVVGVKGNSPEPVELARQLRELAALVDAEGRLRDTERARRLGLAVARTLGPRWSQRRRLLDDPEVPT